LGLIARGGRKFVGISAVASAATLPLFVPLSVSLACLTAFFAVIFRDPPRAIGSGIVSPADGIVRAVDPEKGYLSIYLALRNVHVTRSPFDATVAKVVQIRGKHRPAFSESTPANERVEIDLRTAIGDVSMVQMTGAIARRIVPYIQREQLLTKGQKLSLIRFGSRVDIRMPADKIRMVVHKGQRLYGGKTSIAEVRDAPLD
jgi:phosphatidylserine decarboxylase